jgi:thiol-disulfide isomerase/thioredoxin
MNRNDDVEKQVAASEPTLSGADRSPAPAARRGGATAAFAFFGVVAVAVLFVILFVWISRRQTGQAPDGTQHPAVERLLGQFQLIPLGGDKAVTVDQVRGQVVLINYWGTWCPPCRDEMPYMIKLYEQYGERPDFRMFSVSCQDDVSRQELEEKTRTFLRQNGWSHLPVYTDRQHTSRTVLAILAELGDSFPYPTTLVLDREGQIAGLWTSYQISRAEEIYHEQSQLIAQLLATKPQ